MFLRRLFRVSIICLPCVGSAVVLPYRARAAMALTLTAMIT